MSTNNTALATRDAEIVGGNNADEIIRQIDQTPVPTLEGQPSLVQVNPYIGIAAAPFAPEAAEILMAPIAVEDIEIRPDGLIYLPGIKYRRILNHAFGPGAWSLLPIEITVSPQDNMLYYKGAIFVHGRFVSEAIGEQQYFPENDRMSYATAAESAKSNCLMRCCKDLGIASELWDPSFVKRWISENCREVWCQNVGKGPDSGRKKKMWRKNSSPVIEMWPWKEEAGFESQPVKVEKPRFSDAVERRRSDDDKLPPNVQQARIQAPPAAAPKSAPSSEGNPPARLPAVISFKQAGRYRAIAKSNGWNETGMNEHLKRNGFASSEEITRNEYDRLCLELENPTLFNEISNSVSAAGLLPPKQEEAIRQTNDLPF